MNYGNDLVLTAGGGTHNIGLTIPVRNMFNITGTATLGGNWTIQLDPAVTPLKFMTIILNWSAVIQLATSTITVFGRSLNKDEAALKSTIICYYNGSAWEVRVLIDNTAKASGNIGTTTVNVTGAGGTTTLDPLTANSVQIIKGTGTLAAGIVVGGTGTPKDGDVFAVKYRATMTYAGGNTVSLFGLVLTASQALRGLSDVYAVYDGGTASWIATLVDSTINSNNLWEYGTGTESCQRLNATTGCLAIGDHNRLDGQTVLATGNHNSGSGKTNTVTGNENQVSGKSNVIVGNNNEVSGQQNAISGNLNKAGGYTNTITGDRNFANGYGNHIAANSSMANGYVNEPTGDNSLANGVYSKPHADNQFVTGKDGVGIYESSVTESAGKFNLDGDSQTTRVMLKKATSNNTPANLAKSDSVDGLAIPTDCTAKLKITVVGVQTSGAAGTIGDSFAQEIEVTVKNIAGTLTIVPTNSTTVGGVQSVVSDVVYKLVDNDVAFTGTVAIAISSPTLNIVVTGEANKDIQWTALCNIVMTGYRNYVV